MVPTGGLLPALPLVLRCPRSVVESVATVWEESKEYSDGDGDALSDVDYFCDRAATLCRVSADEDQQQQARAVTKQLLSFTEEDLVSLREMFTIYDKV
jgi:hypothetical protein